MDEKYLETIREYAKDPDPKFRAGWIKYLLDEGAYTWEDLETWAMDPADEVRSEVWSGIGYVRPYQLCDDDKPRCMRLFESSIAKYGVGMAGITMFEMARDDDEWLDLTWKTVDHLLDLEDPDIELALRCGYLQDVIGDCKLGPNDPHIQEWLNGENTDRRITLLGIVTWLGPKQENVRDIAKALTRDTDPQISKFAKDLFAGGGDRGDFADRFGMGF